MTPLRARPFNSVARRRIALVLDNLERLLKCCRELGRVYPKVEAQFIKFQHNVNELDEAIGSRPPILCGKLLA